MKQRNYKEKVINSKAITNIFCTYPSLEALLNNLDNGISTCIETSRNSGRTAISLLYASEILINEEDSMICIYTPRADISLYRMDFMKEMMAYNHPELSESDICKICCRGVAINPSKRWIKRNIKNIEFILYDDIITMTNIMSKIDLKTSKNILSVISSYNPEVMTKRTGFKYFEYIKFMYFHDRKEKADLWFEEMCIKMNYDWYHIRNEVLLDHSGSSDPITQKEIENIKTESFYCKKRSV